MHRRKVAKKTARQELQGTVSVNRIAPKAIGVAVPYTNPEPEAEPAPEQVVEPEPESQWKSKIHRKPDHQGIKESVRKPPCKLRGNDGDSESKSNSESETDSDTDTDSGKDQGSEQESDEEPEAQWRPEHEPPEQESEQETENPDVPGNWQGGQNLDDPGNGPGPGNLDGKGQRAETNTSQQAGSGHDVWGLEHQVQANDNAEPATDTVAPGAAAIPGVVEQVWAPVDLVPSVRIYPCWEGELHRATITN